MLIGYARVSQADGSQSLDLQRDALRAEGVDAGNVARPVNRSALDLNRADHHAATGAHSQPAWRCSRPVGKAGADGPGVA